MSPAAVWWDVPASPRSSSLARPVVSSPTRGQHRRRQRGGSPVACDRKALVTSRGLPCRPGIPRASSPRCQLGLWRGDNPARRLRELSANDLGLLADDSGVVRLAWIGVRLETQAEGAEIVDRKFHQTEAVVSNKHFVRVSSLPRDHHRHRPFGTVVECCAVGPLLPLLLREVPGWDSTPDARCRRSAGTRAGLADHRLCELLGPGERLGEPGVVRTCRRPLLHLTANVRQDCHEPLRTTFDLDTIDVIAPFE